MDLTGRWNRKTAGNLALFSSDTLMIVHVRRGDTRLRLPNGNVMVNCCTVGLRGVSSSEYRPCLAYRPPFYSVPFPFS